MFGNNDEMGVIVTPQRLWRTRWGWFKGGIIVVVLLQFLLLVALYQSGLIKAGANDTNNRIVQAQSVTQPAASSAPAAVQTSVVSKPELWGFVVFVPLVAMPFVGLWLLLRQPKTNTKTSGKYQPPAVPDGWLEVEADIEDNDLLQPLEFPRYRAGRAGQPAYTYGQDKQKSA